MKRIGLSLAFLVGASVSAACAPPFKVNDGIDPTVTVNSMPLGTVQQKAASALQPGQAAPLNSSGQMTSPIASAYEDFETNTPTGVSSASANHGAWPIYSDYTQSADPFMPPDMFMIGGVKLPYSYAGSPLTGNKGSLGNLQITYSPYGPYSAGCALCIIESNGEEQQAGISTLDWRGPSGKVSGSFDSDGEFIGIGNNQPIMILPVASYDATGATLSTPLTAQQMSMLRANMYLTTNTLDTTTSTAPQTGPSGTGIPPQNYYKGIISGFSSDGTRINVARWESPNSGNTTTGQVPSLTSLDAGEWSNYGYPVVFVGQADTTGAANWYINYDGSRAQTTANGGKATSLVHSMGGVEIDETQSATTPAEVWQRGITISQTSTGSAGAAGWTPNSYGLLINSGTPHGAIINVPNNGTVLSSTTSGFFLHGNEGVQNTSRPTQTVMTFGGFADGQSLMSMLFYMNKETSALGANGTSFRLGMHVGGDNTNPLANPNSWGELVWNPLGINQGSIALCGGANEACGIVQHNNGSVTGSYWWNPWSQGLTSGNGLTVGVLPTGHAAALGIYTNGGYTNNLFEAYDGTAFEASLDHNGIFTTNGKIIAGDKVLTGPGASFQMIEPSGQNGGQAYTDPSGDVVLGSLDSGGNSRIVSTLPVVMKGYTFSTLPPTGAGTGGQTVFCSDCLKPSEAAGSGTGMLVFDDGHSHWVSTAGTIAAH